MQTITAGTPSTRTEHVPALSAMGIMVSMGGPVALAVAGIILKGWGAIPWLSAIVWGVLATMAFTLVMLMGKCFGMTRMDLLDMLGSIIGRPHSAGSHFVGFLLHHANGALLAIAWAYGTLLVNVPANWMTGLAWGAIMWVLAMLMMTSIGGLHPAMRRGDEEDPGTAATNFGKMTPMGALVGHLVYGLVLGLLFQYLPIRA